MRLTEQVEFYLECSDFFFFWRQNDGGLISLTRKQPVNMFVTEDALEGAWVQKVALRKEDETGRKQAL